MKNSCAAPLRPDKKRPLLVFAFNYFPTRGGIQTYSYELCRNLHKQGHSIFVLARPVKGDREADAEIPWRVIRMRGTGIRLLRMLPMAFYLIRTVIRHRIRLVHCVNWIPCGFTARLLRPLLFYRYVVTCHGGEITQAIRSPFKRLALASTLKNAAWIIAGNNHVREVIAGLNPGPTPLSVIHFGVDTEVFRPELDADFLRIKYAARNKKILLTVADLKPRKGVDTVLTALKELGERGRDLIYLVAGKGDDQPRLEALAAEYGLADRVVFTGPLSDKDLPFHYAAADVYVMPNRETPDHDIEGFGICFIEAQAAEKPVIGGKSGGVPDSIADGKTGWLCPPDDPKTLAGLILKVLDSPSEARDMGRNGRARVSALFTWPLIANKTEMIYEKVFYRDHRR